MPARIPPAQSPLSPQVEQSLRRLIPQRMRPPELFMSLALNERLFCFLVESGLAGAKGLLELGTLAPTLRECVILRTCVACGNDYEFNLHVQTISEKMGLTPAQIDDIRSSKPGAAPWPEPLMRAMELVDALVVRRRVDDELHSACRQHFSDAELIEITQLAGLYVTVAMQAELIRPDFDCYTSQTPILARRD